MRISLKVIIILSVFLLSNISAQATFTVTNINNDGAGSLAQAIVDANANSGADNIEFNISGDGPHTIAVTSGLPEITDAVSILGYTQTGSAKATSKSIAVLKIEIDGTNSGENQFGLIISTDNCIIEGLAITAFGRGGIFIGGSSNTIRGNHIGVSLDGSQPKGNGFRDPDADYDGVWLDGPNNLIGGLIPEDRNVISGNAFSNIYMGDSVAINNKIQGNFIGPDATGTLKFENQTDGIYCVGGSDNLIGGLEDGAKNIISGNDFSGLYFQTEDGPSTIQGNFIGTDLTGTKPLGNGGVGIGIITGSNFLIGGTEPGAGNLISGNGFKNESGGLGFITLSTGNIIQGNKIGTDVTGTSAIPNLLYGVFIGNSQNNQIGGSSENAGNLISGNDRLGILFSGSQNNIVKGNIIGLDKTGTNELGNSDSGIDMFASSSNTIGGKLSGEKNIISGNGFEGIIMGSPETKKNKIAGNYIGTDLNGSAFIPNAFNGIGIYAGSDNIIGGSELGEGNVIAGNGNNGIFIKEESAVRMLAKKSFYSKFSPQYNLVSARSTKKHIGKKKLIDDYFNDPYRINNQIKKVSSVESDSGYSNSILGNSIYANTNLGIDLQGIDRTNDNEDGDVGPNAGQNHPEINSVTGDGTNATITYLVNSSVANSAYPLHVEFFVADTGGQGKVFLGTDTYTLAEAMTNKSFVFTPNISIGQSELIVATATDDSGNTSEFSVPFITTSIVGVDENGTLHSAYSLNQNYPNPFNPTTTIEFTIPEESLVLLKVFNILGKEIVTLANKKFAAGSYKTNFDGSNLPSGLYLAQLKAGSFSKSFKMMLLK